MRLLGLQVRVCRSATVCKGCHEPIAPNNIIVRVGGGQLAWHVPCARKHLIDAASRLRLTLAHLDKQVRQLVSEEAVKAALEER